MQQKIESNQRLVWKVNRRTPRYCQGKRLSSRADITTEPHLGALTNRIIPTPLASSRPKQLCPNSHLLHEVSPTKVGIEEIVDVLLSNPQAIVLDNEQRSANSALVQRVTRNIIDGFG